MQKINPLFKALQIFFLLSLINSQEFDQDLDQALVTQFILKNEAKKKEKKRQVIRNHQTEADCCGGQGETVIETHSESTSEVTTTFSVNPSSGVDLSVNLNLDLSNQQSLDFETSTNQRRSQKTQRPSRRSSRGKTRRVSRSEGSRVSEVQNLGGVFDVNDNNNSFPSDDQIFSIVEGQGGRRGNAISERGSVVPGHNGKKGRMVITGNGKVVSRSPPDNNQNRNQNTTQTRRDDNPIIVTVETPNMNQGRSPTSRNREFSNGRNQIANQNDSVQNSGVEIISNGGNSRGQDGSDDEDIILINGRLVKQTQTRNTQNAKNTNQNVPQVSRSRSSSSSNFESSGSRPQQTAAFESSTQNRRTERPNRTTRAQQNSQPKQQRGNPNLDNVTRGSNGKDGQNLTIINGQVVENGNGQNISYTKGVSKRENGKEDIFIQNGRGGRGGKAVGAQAFQGQSGRPGKVQINGELIDNLQSAGSLTNSQQNDLNVQQGVDQNGNIFAIKEGSQKSQASTAELRRMKQHGQLRKAQPQNQNIIELNGTLVNTDKAARKAQSQVQKTSDQLDQVFTNGIQEIQNATEELNQLTRKKNGRQGVFVRSGKGGKGGKGFGPGAQDGQDGQDGIVFVSN